MLSSVVPAISAS